MIITKTTRVIGDGPIDSGDTRRDGVTASRNTPARTRVPTRTYTERRIIVFL